MAIKFKKEGEINFKVRSRTTASGGLSDEQE
jgi:hypothetical protein